jgi:hypothetical protein
MQLREAMLGHNEAQRMREGGRSGVGETHYHHLPQKQHITDPLKTNVSPGVKRFARCLGVEPRAGYCSAGVLCHFRRAMAKRVSKMSDLFGARDDARDSVVTFKEFCEGVKLMGLCPKPTKYEMEALFKHFDVHGNGIISWQEVKRGWNDETEAQTAPGKTVTGPMALNYDYAISSGNASFALAKELNARVAEEREKSSRSTAELIVSVAASNRVDNRCVVHASNYPVFFGKLVPVAAITYLCITTPTSLN